MKITTLLKTGLYGAVLIAALMTPGCVSSSRVNTAPSANVGQQLLDLDKAYKDGIITQDQYDKLKRTLIRKYQ